MERVGKVEGEYRGSEGRHYLKLHKANLEHDFNIVGALL